ncbi:hypothetical protein CVT24_012605 [Panaeolus cyanescens]|uniref:Uncharacterized protein n=1 Tax=Panaeolus cyanescens TaxID=181874 RepID=A0A409YJU6_9AGAR|nr:hypothetical protein CVT24_012605 [Panaeolus cyanescens]
MNDTDSPSQGSQAIFSIFGANTLVLVTFIRRHDNGPEAIDDNILWKKPPTVQPAPGSRFTATTSLIRTTDRGQGNLDRPQTAETQASTASFPGSEWYPHQSFAPKTTSSPKPRKASSCSWRCIANMPTKQFFAGMIFLAVAMLVTVVGAHNSSNALDGLLRPISIEPSSGTVHRRQGAIPSVPSQCKSTCDPINTILSTGCRPQQCCTESFTKGYFDCFECVADSVGLTDFTDAQTIVDGIITTCAARGISLPVLTFPGQNPSRTLATVAPPSTSNPTTSRTTISNTGDVTSTPDSSTTRISQSTVTSLPTPTTPAPSPATTPGAGFIIRVTRGEVLSGAIAVFSIAKLLQIVL